MPVLKTQTPTGEWEALLAGRDGAQGPPGPASPHEGSHIAVSVQQHGAAGDGTSDDTADVQATLEAAGDAGFVDFEAGTYLVTGNLGLDFWRARKSGPGVITDASGNTFRISPRGDDDVNTIYVNGDTGDDDNDGLSPTRALKTLAGVDEVLSLAAPDRGQWVVRLTGEFEGHRFADLPSTRLPIIFQGDPLVDGEPVTTIRRVTAQIGIFVQPAVGRTVTFRNLAMKDFTGGSGFGMLWAQGGSVRVENCLAENCGTGFAMRDNANMSVLDTTARNCTTSGFRSQYFANGAWTRCTATACNEGFHVSRNSVMHVDYCVAEDSNRSGLWLDMAARAQSIASTYRRNAWYGIRGEGHATVDVNQTSAGGNVFGTGPDANGFKDVSLAGTAILATTEGIHAVPEHLADTWAGSSTSSVQMRSDRSIAAYRVGRGSRVRIRVWGDGGGSGGSIDIRFGSRVVRTVQSLPGVWLVELTAQHDNSQWQILSTLNGAGPTIQSLASLREEIRPTLVPAGVTIRGAEFYTGG